MTAPKTIRMIGHNVTEVNFSEWGIFQPRDDGAFLIPEAAVAEACKAGLVVAELSNSEKLRRIVDLTLELDEQHRVAIFAAISAVQLTVWHHRQEAAAASA